MCKVLAHMKINGNETAVVGKGSNGYCHFKIPSTDHFPAIKKARNSEWQRKWDMSTSKLHNIKPNNEESESSHKLRKITTRLPLLAMGNKILEEKYALTAWYRWGNLNAHNPLWGSEKQTRKGAFKINTTYCA